MKTSKVLAVVAMTGLLSTGLYAVCYGPGQGQGQGMMKQQGMMNQQGMMKRQGMMGQSCGMQGKNMMMKKGMHNKGKNGPLSLLRKLNLTPEQQTQIAKIRQDIFSKKVRPDVAFSKEGFDKAKFIEIMKQKRENMIESKAEMIDRVYKVLTPEQKEQFKVLMDLKRERMQSMMNRRMNFDKNCYGRR